MKSKIEITKVAPSNGRAKYWSWGVEVEGLQVAVVRTKGRALAITNFVASHPELDINKTNFEDLVP